MKSCVFCRTTSKSQGVTFHRFPMDHRRAVWVERVQRDSQWQPKKTSMLCSRHFQQTCFEAKSQFGTRKILKKDALPTIFNGQTTPQPEPKHLPDGQPQLKEKGSRKEMIRTEGNVSKGDLNGQRRFHERLQMVVKDHNYPLPSAPELWRRLQSLSDSHERLHRKVKLLRTQLCKKRKRFVSLKLSLSKWKKWAKSGQTLHRSPHPLAKLALTPSLQHIFARITNKHLLASEYPQELREWALTLLLYSPRAYDFVRKSFLNALPHVATIRKWFTDKSAPSGLSEFALKLLQSKVDSSSDPSDLR